MARKSFYTGDSAAVPVEAVTITLFGDDKRILDGVIAKMVASTEFVTPVTDVKSILVLFTKVKLTIPERLIIFAPNVAASDASDQVTLNEVIALPTFTTFVPEITLGIWP
jgi:hypothetical protein